MKNMMDMVSMVKKAQAVQSQMAAVQNKLEKTEFTGLAADGAVQIVVTGKLAPVAVSPCLATVGQPHQIRNAYYYPA